MEKIPFKDIQIGDSFTFSNPTGVYVQWWVKTSEDDESEEDESGAFNPNCYLKVTKNSSKKPTGCAKANNLYYVKQNCASDEAMEAQDNPDIPRFK